MATVYRQAGFGAMAASSAESCGGSFDEASGRRLRITYHGFSCEVRASEGLVCCKPKLASGVSVAGFSGEAERQRGFILQARAS
jgi:hypothetical protein